MNRLAALESDLRAAKKNSRRRRSSAHPPAAAPIPAPAPPTAAPAAAAPPAPPPAPAPTTDAVGSVAASVGAAMANWAGTSHAASRHTAGYARAKRTEVNVDYRVPNLPMPMRQPSNMVCWATVATMMASWRDQQSHTLSGYIDGLGEPWKTKLANNQGLAAAEAPVLLATMGLQVVTVQASFSYQAWEHMLQDFGPLWVTADNNSMPGIQGVHAHILVGVHGPITGNPTAEIIDPATGTEVTMPMADFVSRYEQLAGTAFAGLQIRHWPAGAQRAAQQSIRWAQQASTRYSRAHDDQSTLAPGDAAAIVAELDLLPDDGAVTQQSVYSRHASAPTFADLWANHPSNATPPDGTPCRSNGASNFTNQCVIRFGLSLVRSGISLDSYPGAFCWHGHGRQHPLRVEEMKLWLNSSAAGFVGQAEISRRDATGTQRTSADYAGRTGLAVFRNFYGPGNQGDHVDLWNGNRLGGGNNNYFERSEEIWFWPYA